MKPIADLNELKKMAGDEPVDASIVLNYGARSALTVQYFPDGCDAENDQALADEMELPVDVFTSEGYAPYGEMREGVKIKWSIYHGISECYCEYENDEILLNETNIGTAIERGALIKH